MLSLKPQLTRFAGGVTAEELRGAVLLGLIGFVIYPVLPSRPVDPWGLLNPREAWLTVILIAGLGFVNYVLLRIYSTRGLYYTAVFGGLVNSTAAVAELSGSMEGEGSGPDAVTVTVTLLTVLAMFVRNLVVVSVFSPAARVTDPEGREWEIYAYRIQLPPRGESDPGSSGEIETGRGFVPNPLDGIFWLLSRFLLMLQRLFWDLPRAVLAARQAFPQPAPAASSQPPLIPA